jgi:predicted transposase YdaD
LKEGRKERRKEGRKKGRKEGKKEGKTTYCQSSANTSPDDIIIVDLADFQLIVSASVLR